MEKKELQRYIDWIVEEILMNPNQRSRKDIELMEKCEFGNRTVELVTNLINELVDRISEDRFTENELKFLRNLNATLRQTNLTKEGEKMRESVGKKLDKLTTK